MKMQRDFAELGVASGVEDVHIREGNAEGMQGGEEDTGLGGMEYITTRISSHPLYDKLVEIHLDCLKVSGVDNLDATSQITTPQQQHRSKPHPSFPDHFSDLDQFMEAYCLVLSKLREAMEEPQQEAMSFIDDMQSQLEEINRIPCRGTTSSFPILFVRRNYLLTQRRDPASRGRSKSV